VSDRPVVVTGAAGLIGSAVAGHLAASGMAVLGIVRTGNPATSVRARVADLAMPGAFVNACAELAPRAVVHCAAAVPAPSRPDDDATAERTRRLDSEVVAACKRGGWPLIYLSGCALYDPTDPALKSEDAPVAGRTPYTAAKLAGERLVAALPSHVVLRVSSPVGTSPVHRTVFDRFVEDATEGRSLGVWGSGSREQDFVWVEDVAEFVGCVLESAVGGVFNVASGAPVTMRRLAETVVDVVGRGAVASVDHPDPQDAHTARYDVNAARGLGWVPRHDLRDMIHRRAARA
jgi:nucleoside-diphosphate-sugar epimerase